MPGATAPGFFFGARPLARCRRFLTMPAPNPTVDSPKHGLPRRRGASGRPWPHRQGSSPLDSLAIAGTGRFHPVRLEGRVFGRGAEAVDSPPR
jgi:hypothetical protein